LGGINARGSATRGKKEARRENILYIVNKLIRLEMMHVAALVVKENSCLGKYSLVREGGGTEEGVREVRMEEKRKGKEITSLSISMHVVRRIIHKRS
jgi:hypothetical protein